MKILLCVPNNDEQAVEREIQTHVHGATTIIPALWKSEQGLRSLEECNAVVVSELHPEVGFCVGYAVARGKTVIIVGTTDSLMVTDCAYRVPNYKELLSALKPLVQPPTCSCSTFSECAHK